MPAFVIIHTLPSEADRKYAPALPGRISSNVATNSNGLSPVIVEVAIGVLIVVLVISGVTNENVGSTDGSIVATNENVGRRATVDKGAAVAVGAMVDVAGTEVVGNEVGVLGMLWGAQAANSVNPNKRTMNLQS